MLTLPVDSVKLKQNFGDLESKLIQFQLNAGFSAKQNEDNNTLGNILQVMLFFVLFITCFRLDTCFTGIADLT